jgi:electron transfer flavoprotein alpha subunit
MSTVNLRNCKGLWVFIEQRDGKPARVSIELLGAGRGLADKLGEEVTAILIGDDISGLAQELIYWGADRVFIADDPVAKNYRTEVYADIVVEQVIREKPEVLLIGATWVGRDFAPRVAARLNTGCTADCTGLDIDIETRLLVATKPYFGRNLMADIACPFYRPQVVTVRPGVMELKAKERHRKGELIPIEVKVREEDVRVKVVETVRSVSDAAALEQADKVVAGGMGVGDAKGFKSLREFAHLLGAQLGATSLPVDEGWISEDCKIGQTGKIVRPRLYIGCGVSGAIQHSAGMINSEMIVAINTDPRAEIFQIADYGIIGDVNEVIPALIRETRRLRAQKEAR